MVHGFDGRRAPLGYDALESRLLLHKLTQLAHIADFQLAVALGSRVDGLLAHRVSRGHLGHRFDTSFTQKTAPGFRGVGSSS